MIWLIGLFIVRFASLRPSFIDDDEAWFSASARALHNPLKFYFVTPDNKPPGTVWFYWLLGGDPILARLALIGLTTLTAYLVYRVCLKIRRSSSVAKTSAGLFLCSSAFFPKLFAVTNEGLVLILSTAMLSVWLLAIERKKLPGLGLCVVSGVLGSMMMLLKQTSLVYGLPVFFVLYSLRDSAEFRKSLCSFLASFFVPLALFVFLLDAHAFYYWNFTYTTNVLTQARSGLFPEFKELIQSLLIFGLAVSPLLVSAVKRWQKSQTEAFLALWFFSALCAALVGWGLFLHYFIPLVAPLCFASGLNAFEGAWSRKHAVGFSTALYGLSACVLLIPNSTTFFGTDLFYYGKLAAQIQKLSQPGDTVCIWGANPIALALSSRSSVPGFLTTRFAAGPYSTNELESQFHKSFEQASPLLFVDLHEKHDNRFRLDPHSTDWLNAALNLRYEKLPDSSLPWASIYRLKNSLSNSVFKPLPAEKDETLASIHLQNLSSLLWKPTLWLASLRLARQVDPLFRAWISLSFIADGSNAILRQKLKMLVQKKILEINSLADNGIKPADEDPSENTQDDFPSEVTASFTLQGWEPPLPLQSRAWWMSMALTDLQP